MEFCVGCKGRLPEGGTSCPQCGRLVGRMPGRALGSDLNALFGLPGDVEVMIATLAIVPFLQSFVTEAGRDSYAALRKMIEKARKQAAGQSEDANAIDPGKGVVVIRDPERNIMLAVRDDLPAPASHQLFSLNLSQSDLRDGVIVYDDRAARWEFRSAVGTLHWDPVGHRWAAPEQRSALAARLAKIRRLLPTRLA